MSFMPFFFSCVLLHYLPLAFPSAFCQLLLIVWPKANNIDPLLTTCPGPPHLFPVDTCLVHLTLSLLTSLGAQSPSAAPLLSPLPLVRPPLSQVITIYPGHIGRFKNVLIQHTDSFLREFDTRVKTQITYLENNKFLEETTKPVSVRDFI